LKHYDKKIYQTQISERIGKSKSVICRELKRNSDLRNGVYKADLAERKCKQRHREKPKIVRFTTAIKQFVDTWLKQDYSPDQIVGTANKLGVLCVSIERIYQYIWYDKHKLGTLYTHLRRKGENTEKEGLQKTRPTSKNSNRIRNRLLLRKPLL